MLSLKRVAFIFISVIILGAVFLVVSTLFDDSAINYDRSGSSSNSDFLQAIDVSEGDKPNIHIIGESESYDHARTKENVLDLCKDLQFQISEDDCLLIDTASENDIAIICDTSLGSYTTPDDIEQYIKNGGRIILASGISKDEKDFFSIFGIDDVRENVDCHELVFEKPFLPLEPEEAFHAESSSSSIIDLQDQTVVYVSDSENENPILFGCDTDTKKTLVINGSFLANRAYAGLLTGAICAISKDMVYPVLGVKAVFLDSFPTDSPANNELCNQLYGHSLEGLMQDAIWPTLQGLSLRTKTPFTASIVVESSEQQEIAEYPDEIFMDTAKSIIQFDGELIYASKCENAQKIIFDQNVIDQMGSNFPSYTITGLALQTSEFSLSMLGVRDANIDCVRGILGDENASLSWKDGLAIFPAITKGCDIENGNLFAICSGICSYGAISHVIEVDKLITDDNGVASWDTDKLQLGILESDVLSKSSWLEGKTLSDIKQNVKSYKSMEYGWTANDDVLEIECSGALVGQTFFYHTDKTIGNSHGVFCDEIGNGYYLLRIQDTNCSIELKEGN